MNYKWNYEPLTQEETAVADSIASNMNVSPVIGKLLSRRGVKTADEARKFFHPQLLDLLDPFRMKDMDKAVERLNEAMGRKEKILIYGDYDVDGCTSVALVYRFLQKYYSNLDFYIPDRYDEGYGVSIRAIDLAKENGVSLIIVLDCGIKAHEEISYAKENGIDFIICDHHVPDAQLPPAVAILNAKRADDDYPFKELSGCGVGFKFMQAFALSNNIAFKHLIPLLDLCAVSIAADLVPVLNENRILAYHGLRMLNSSPSIGLKAIIDSCGLTGKSLTMNDIVFRIGPRINASGRMQNGRVSVQLLIAHDLDSANEIAQQINLYNDERKELDKKMTEEAHEIVENTPELKESNGIVIYNENWHMGVIGIVASRLTELYYRPAVVLTRSGDCLIGSARSVEGFDIYKAIEHCKDLLENFGGHTYAAGLSIPIENLVAFRTRFNEYVKTHISDTHDLPVLNIDLEVHFAEINRHVNSMLKHMEPFGPQNEKPVFCSYNVFDYGTSKVVGKEQEHIRLELIDNSTRKVQKGIAFKQSSELQYVKTKESFDIAFTVEDNVRKENEIQLHILDIRPTKRTKTLNAEIS